MILKGFLIACLTFGKCLKSVEKIVALKVRFCIEQQKNPFFPLCRQRKKKAEIAVFRFKNCFFTGLFEKKEYNASLFLMFLIKG